MQMKKKNIHYLSLNIGYKAMKQILSISQCFYVLKNFANNLNSKLFLTCFFHIMSSHEIVDDILKGSVVIFRDIKKIHIYF